MIIATATSHCIFTAFHKCRVLLLILLIGVSRVSIAFGATTADHCETKQKSKKKIAHGSFPWEKSRLWKYRDHFTDSDTVGQLNQLLRVSI